MADSRNNKKILDMTQGPFLKKMLLFAIPLMLTGLLQLFYNSADTVIVGRFAGKESLAAVGATGSLVALVLNLFVGLSMGSGVMEAGYIGGKNEEKMHRCTHTAMTLSVISGIVIAVFGFFFAKDLLFLMKSPDDVIDLSTAYLKIFFLGAPGSMVFNFGASLLRAMGDTKRPLIFLAGSGVVNIILNLILVIPFGMGVRGVAIATITSQYISAVCTVICLVKLKNPCRLEFKKLRIYKAELLAIAKIGIPAGIQNSLFSISNVIIQSSVNTFGSVAMAGIAAGSNFDGYIYNCTNAVAQTAMNFSSQNIGAKKYENIGKIFRRCLAMTTVIACVMSLVGLVFRNQIVWIFTKDAPVIEIGASRLALVMPFYVFCSLQDTVAGQVRGMGRSLEPMIVSIFGTCVIRLLWIFVFLPKNPTLINLYWAYPISWFVTFVLMIGVYCYANHRMKKLI
ncbi:MAG: MATE family efflux transporter [Ruminococcus sp.]|nr:MATE family efflux transporter [Ruminococcus sp.]